MRLILKAKTYGVDKWRIISIPSEHLISRHFLAVNQGGRTEKWKMSTFFYFYENGEKLKKLEKFLVLSFSQ